MRIMSVVLLLVTASVFSQAPKKFLADNYPVLHSAASAVVAEENYTALKNYAYTVTETKWIKSEEDIRAMMALRDDVIMEILGNMLMDMDEDSFMSLAWDFDVELKRLGMTMITAEGYFLMMGRDTLLDAAVHEYGSVEYANYIDIGISYDNTFGGEYPFIDVSNQAILAKQCEWYLHAFPNGEFAGTVEEYFREAIEVLSDVHLVTMQDYAYYCYSAIEIDEWPFLTEIESAASYYSESPTSPYAQAIHAIITNISTIDSEADSLCYIVTDWFGTVQEARDKVWAYLGSGIDIPHILSIQRPDGIVRFGVGYRFFTDSYLALEALAHLEAGNKVGEMIRLTNLHNWGEPLMEVE